METAGSGPLSAREVTAPVELAFKLARIPVEILGRATTSGFDFDLQHTGEETGTRRAAQLKGIELPKSVDKLMKVDEVPALNGVPLRALPVKGLPVSGVPNLTALAGRLPAAAQRTSEPANGVTPNVQGLNRVVETAKRLVPAGATPRSTPALPSLPGTPSLPPVVGTPSLPVAAPALPVGVPAVAAERALPPVNAPALPIPALPVPAPELPTARALPVDAPELPIPVPALPVPTPGLPTARALPATPVDGPVSVSGMGMNLNPTRTLIPARERALPNNVPSTPRVSVPQLSVPQPSYSMLPVPHLPVSQVRNWKVANLSKSRVGTPAEGLAGPVRLFDKVSGRL